MQRRVVELGEADLAVGDEVAPDRIRKIVEQHDGALGGLVAVLADIQAEYGFLPEQALRLVAAETGRSLVDIFGVANFYHAFSLEPRGKHLVSVCLGTACHVRGGAQIVSEFERQLGIRVGETTADREFTLKTVNCLGACALGPVVLIDGRYFAKVRTPRVKSLLAEAQRGFDYHEVTHDERIIPLDVSCPTCNHSLMDERFSIEGYPSIRVTVSFGDRHGWLRLSSLYGRYNVYSEYDVPLHTVVNFFCPHCHSELIGAWACSVCSAPMVPMIVRGGGTVRICSRRGCTGSDSHMLDLI